MTSKPYVYSKAAESDVINIYQTTYQTWGNAQADSYDAALEQTLNLLSHNPDIGRACDELKPGYRRFSYERHTIFYRKRQRDILIIRILHAHMDVTRHI